MFTLGVIIAIGAAGFFAALGIFTLWGGTNTLTNEMPRGFVRSGSSGAQRALSFVVIALPLVVTGLFGLLAAARFLQIAFGLG